MPPQPTRPLFSNPKVNDTEQSMDRSIIENTKAGFSLAEFRSARDKTFEAVNRISQSIKVGMNEDEGNLVVKTILSEMGSAKSWHKGFIRFGANTLKGFSDKSETGVRLQSDDIYFIDIGPVWGEYEGDGGDTFAVGNNPEMVRCAQDVKTVFHLTSEAWKKSGLTGKELYEFADQAAKKLGWTLNLDINGHRLADFPHAVYFRGGLSEVEFKPTSNLWMLEIQIRHPTLSFGAFYEDLLS